MRKVAIGLVVLLLVLVGVDRVGDLVAERASAASLQDSQDLAEEPKVSIGGFPFLTQLWTRDFADLEVRAVDVPVRDRDGEEIGIHLSRLDIRLRGVTASRDLNRFDVRKAQATAVLGYDELGDLLGVDLTAAPDGRIGVSKEFDVFGRTVEPKITIRPQLVEGALEFSEPTVKGLSARAEFVTDQLNDLFGTPIPLQGIPFEISVDDLGADREGIQLQLSGTDLTYVADE